MVYRQRINAPVLRRLGGRGWCWERDFIWFADFCLSLSPVQRGKEGEKRAEKKAQPLCNNLFAGIVLLA